MASSDIRTIQVDRLPRVEVGDIVLLRQIVSFGRKATLDDA